MLENATVGIQRKGSTERRMTTKQQVVEWLEQLAKVYADNKSYLTELDSAIGDADHGINMARGFAAVVDKVSGQDLGLGAALKTVGMTLVQSVGGAAGPLYGTFFLRAAGVCSDKEELTSADIVAMFEAGIEGVRQRGKAEPGDKTMLDALGPALEAMKAAQEDGEDLAGVLEKGRAAAEKGMQDTVPLVARKGRASYLGERSAGHQDPGATSSHLLLKTALETLPG